MPMRKREKGKCLECGLRLEEEYRKEFKRIYRTEPLFCVDCFIEIAEEYQDDLLGEVIRESMERKNNDILKKMNKNQTVH